MLKIILLFVVLDIHKNCYENSAQTDRRKIYIYENRNSSLRDTISSSQTKSSQNHQSKETFGLNIKIGNNFNFVQATKSQDENRILRRANRNSFRQVWTSYRTVKDHEESETPNTGEILNRDSVENGGNKNENQSGQGKSVRFFRRNNYWKPKRVVSFKPNNFQYDKKNSYKSEYEEQDHQPLNKYNYKNQNVLKDQVYSDCCNVVSNTITILNPGSKPIHNFKAPDYLPPLNPPTYIAPEYLPPKTGINDETNMTSTTHRPIERGDVPDEDDSPEVAPAMAIPVPSLPDDEPRTTADSTTIGTSTSRVTTIKMTAITSPNKLTTTAAEPSKTPESNRNLIYETSFKGFGYLPPKDSSTESAMTPQFPGPAPAMAMQVPPEPDDETTEPPTAISTTLTPVYQTEETLPPPLPVTFRGPEYLPPGDRTTTPAMTPQFPGPAPAMAVPVPPEPDDETTKPPTSVSTASTTVYQTKETRPPASPVTVAYLPPKATTIPAISTSSNDVPAVTMPVPPELEESPSTSLSINDFGSAEKLSTSTSSIPIVLDTNPFRAPEYLPPRQIVPVLPAAPAKDIPVTLDSDSNSNDSPNIDPRSFIN